MPLKILADQNITNVEAFFAQHGELQLKPGHLITNQDLKDIDVLLIRTITTVDEKLLHNTAVRLVASMTAGFDHIDQDYLASKNIQFIYAPGCNAIAVLEYLLCCIAALQKQQKLLGNNLTAGIVGVGHVGSIVATTLAQMGFKVLLNDPPRYTAENNFPNTPLHELVNCDLICLHTPLTTSGPHPTHQLITDNFLSQLNPNCILLNAGRGEVINEQALLKYNFNCCLDVWTNEPAINLELFNKTLIATPHIAGYSLQAKQKATQIVYQQCAKLFGWGDIENKMKKEALNLTLPNDWQKLALNIFDPVLYSKHCKMILLNSNNVAEDFLKLRKNYILRKNIINT